MAAGPSFNRQSDIGNPWRIGCFMPVRTFLAIDLDEAILDRLAAAEADIRDDRAKMRWVERDNRHITLNFLGDVPDDLLNDVCKVAAGAAGEVEAFEFRVRGVACVPASGRQLRMLWAGVDDPAGRMTKLQARLADGLSGLGLRGEERAFKPHVTLARIRFVKDPGPLRSAAGKFADADFGARCAEELVAYASRLTPAGPVYTPVARARLGKG